MDSTTAYALNMANSWAQAEYANNNTKQLQQNSFAQQNKILEQTQQYNLDLWNKSNEYNSPKAQMQRLAEAGINPNMAFMQGQTQNTTQQAQAATAPSAASGQGIAPQADQVGWLNFAIAKKQLDLENRKLDIEESKANASNRNLNTITDQLLAKFEDELEALRSSNRVNDATYSKLLSDVSVNATQIEQMNSQIELNEALSSAKYWETHKSQIMTELEKQKLSGEVKYLAEQIVYLQSQEDVNEKQISLFGAEIDLKKSEKGRVDWEVRYEKANRATREHAEAYAKVVNAIATAQNAALTAAKIRLDYPMRGDAIDYRGLADTKALDDAVNTPHYTHFFNK